MFLQDAFDTCFHHILNNMYDFYFIYKENLGLW